MREIRYREEEIDINEIKEDEELKTLAPPNNSINDLEESLKENSQIFPLIVDRNYVLIDGYTRFSIMKKLGFTRVRVLRYDLDVKEDRVEVLKLVWVFNGARRQLDKNEKIAFYARISDAIINAMKSEKKETVKLNKNTISASEYERILEELDKDTHYLSESDKQKFAIIKIYAPWLADYITNVKYKVPLNSIYSIYEKLKKTDILEKIKALPDEVRDFLITTKEGRRIILNDKYSYILHDILNGKVNIKDVIEKIKIEEKKKPKETESQQVEVEKTDKTQHEPVKMENEGVAVIMSKEKIVIKLNECNLSIPEVKKANISVYNENGRILKSGVIHIYKDRNNYICEINIEIFEN